MVQRTCSSSSTCACSAVRNLPVVEAIVPSPVAACSWAAPRGQQDTQQQTQPRPDHLLRCRVPPVQPPEGPAAAQRQAHPPPPLPLVQRLPVLALCIPLAAAAAAVCLPCLLLRAAAAGSFVNPLCCSSGASFCRRRSRQLLLCPAPPAAARSQCQLPAAALLLPTMPQAPTATPQHCAHTRVC